jgi:uncharacterized protein YbjT (DUF2867 family)
MVKVAIAGGTGGVGLHLVEAILESKKHEVIVLSRSQSSPGFQRLGVKVYQVSYDSPSALASALCGVHTVISTISGYDEKTLAGSQLALLDAALKAGVKRFAPSEFSVHSAPDNAIEVWRHKWTVVEALRKSGIEYTLFEPGVFTNYLGDGTMGLGHLRPLKAVFDMENCKMTIPGDGSAEVVMTRVEDVGRFVAASLDLETWPEVSQMRGDRKSLREILRLAEVVRGKPPFMENIEWGLTLVCREEIRRDIFVLE